MQELLKTTSELSDVISGILTGLRDSLEIVVAEIATELTSFIIPLSLDISYTIIELIDDIFDLYPEEWVMAARRMQELNSRIDSLIYDKTLRINTIINNFTILTDTLINNCVEQLELIDNTIDPQYNERMFVIYGRIGELSIAINAPPSYLEEAIQNARFFAMSIACSVGLSYYQFQLDWNYGVERLLIRIGNSVSLYQRNPQWIKVDIETELIKPIFELEIANRRREKERINYLENTITDLQDLVPTLSSQIDENKQAIIDLYDLKIEPILKEIISNFDNWKEDIYDTRTEFVNKSFVSLFLQIVEAIHETKRILGLLNYGGDLLLRVDKLADYLRIEQEDKIADITTRSFRRLVPEWTAAVKEGIG